MTKRNDTEFWKALPSMMEKTEFIKEHFETFKKSIPIQTLFQGEHNMFFSANWIQVMQGLELFDTDYIKSNLTSSLGQGKIDKYLKDYDNYLDQTEKSSYIDHKVLLEQNRTVIKLDRI